MNKNFIIGFLLGAILSLVISYGLFNYYVNQKVDEAKVEEASVEESAVEEAAVENVNQTESAARNVPEQSNTVVVNDSLQSNQRQASYGSFTNLFQFNLSKDFKK